MKSAVILVNLGGPESSRRAWRYLYNLFSDPAILRLPAPLRQILAGVLATLRAGTTKRLYARIGSRSALRERTEEQARALEICLGNPDEIKCFTAMRYSSPSIREVLKLTQEWHPEKIIFLPLYPQYSYVTTVSGWRELKKHAGKEIPIVPIWSYPEDKGFVTALANLIRLAYEEARQYGTPRVLFSAHGLPEKIVRDGDPYPIQCEQTVRAIVAALDISDLDWLLCYQSRIGPFRWLGPATKDEIVKVARDKRPILVVPVSFVSENLETLVEIAMEGKKTALTLGAPYFANVPAVGTEPAFMEGLAGLVRKALSAKDGP